MNGKNPASPKPAAASNIPNDNHPSANPLALLSTVGRLIEQHQGDKALHLLKKIPLNVLPLSARAEVYDQKGTAYQLTGRFLDAFRSFQKSFSFYEVTRDATGQMQAAHHCGEALRQIERFPEAIRWYRRVISKKNPLYVDSLCGQALAWRGLGHYRNAIAGFKRCLASYKDRRDKQGMAYALWAIGSTQRFAGQLKEAEFHLRRSLYLYRKVRDLSGSAYTMCALGGTLRMRGRAVESGRLYHAANKQFAKFGDRFGLAYSFCGQGNAERMQGGFRRGLRLMNKAVQEYERLNQQGPLGYVLWARAQAWISLGRLQSANADLSRAQKLFRLVRDRRGFVYCNLGWGEYFSQKKEFSSARRYYKSAYRRARKEKLLLEAVHARRKLFPHVSHWSGYKKCGIDLIHFRKYTTFP